MISSAISRAVQWLMGRPESSGSSQAMASIWHRCVAVIRAGAPGRGRSSNRSSTLRSFSAMGLKVSHRFRHNRGVSTLIPTSPAIWALLFPSAAAKMIRARKAICCRVLWRRVNVSRACRSSSVSLISVAFGPGITSTFAITEFAYFTQFAPVVKLAGYLRQSALAVLALQLR